MAARRTIDREVLREWIDQQDRGALGELAVKTKISVHTLTKMAYGRYTSNSSAHTRRKLCNATGIDEDTLFPEQTSKEEAS